MSVVRRRSPTMRITLIHNPRAGSEQPSRSELLTLVRGAGHEVSYQSSKDDEWEAALEREADLIVVAGGDGTVAKVAKRLVGRRVPLTILPLGTANNISKTLGLTGSPLQLVAGWEAARRVTVDLGVATGPWGDTAFIEAFGVGLFPGLMSRPQAQDHVFIGPVAAAHDRMAHILRLLQGSIRHSPARDVTVELDGRGLSGKYFLVEAMNTKFIGPNLHLAPDADPADGRLDLVLLTDDDREMLARYVESELNGHTKPRPVSHRGRHLHLRWEGFPVHIDDEVWPANGDPLPSSPAAVHARMDGQWVEFLVP
jgi:diacylglycerol kinase (ATP)